MKIDKKAKKAITLFLLFTSIAMIIFVLEKYTGISELTKIKRNSYGKGSTVKELEVFVEGEKEGHPIQLEVGEQEYTPTEIKDVFKRAMKDLDSLILAENKSLDYIDSNLDLINEIPNTGISVEWELDRYDVMDVSGRLNKDMLNEKGTLVELRAYLFYREEKALHNINAVLYLPLQTKEEKVISEIKDTIKEKNNKTKESKEMFLPQSLNGKKLRWQSSTGKTGYTVFLLGIVSSVYLYLADKQRRQKKEKERRNQMLFDYPEIVSQLVLLIGAGMTVKRAWQTIVHNYQNIKNKRGIRYAYEEMSYTYREQQSKVMEIDSYEGFGKRCKVQEYVKFAALLTQNIRKGTSGLTSVLTVEAKNAFSERKNRAKRLGEEASTKLLLPMFIMLSVVLVIIIIPAFLSFQI